MAEKLKNAPMVESICEFRFDPSGWDWTIPGQLFDKIGTEFSVRSQVQAMDLQIQPDPSKPALTSIHTTPDRVQLKRPDGTAMVQVGPYILAVNHFRPYPGWAEFKSLVMKIYSEYMGLVDKTEFQRVGLRYINVISIPSQQFEIGKYITLDPPLAGPLNRRLDGFYQRYEIAYDSPKGTLIHQTGIQIVEEGKAIMLDLDFVSTEVGNIEDPESVPQLIDSAHDRLHEAFVGSLNPEFYEKLKSG